MAILEMKNISKAFAGVPANEEVNLTVEKGEIHALLGENGAGKTTLMNILFGIYQADGGKIIWKGDEAAFTSPRQAIERGIGMVHQHFSLVQNMSVLDNILLGLKQDSLFLPRRAAKKSVQDLAERYGLSVKPDAMIYELSVGEQQRVEILKALYRHVELLILDEPTGVLTPQETEHFFDVLQKLKAEGYAVIIITHRMSEIMAVSDRVTILRNGRTAASLATKDTTPAQLTSCMIGRELAQDYPIDELKPGETSLSLAHVSIHKGRRRPVLDDINLTLHRGEILGIAGVDGNGQKELAEVITGIRRQTSGQISFLGQDISRASVKKRFTLGISYISDDRHTDGLITGMSVVDNLILRCYQKPPYSRHAFFRRRPIEDFARGAVERYQVKTPSLAARVSILSGGNQQKIILAREIADGIDCIVANQPTRGLDMGAAESVRMALLKQRNEQKSVLLISADLEEILMLSDRIAVMFGGRIVGVLDRKEAGVQKIGLLMGGITEEEVSIP